MKVFIRFILLFGLICIGFAQSEKEISEIPGLNYPCNACHKNTGWADLDLTGFHHDSTGFRLQDAHEYIDCTACHKGKSMREIHKFGDAPNECGSCHTDIHQGQFGASCETCHSPKNWLTNRNGFRHELTIFPLTGSHLGVACSSCHPNDQEGTYRGASLVCADCHQDAYTRANSTIADHYQFSDRCEYCHTSSRWQEPEMDHSRTGFPLLGKHQSAPCISCHEDQYVGTDTECFVCHYNEYDQTTDPPHIQQIYPLTECKSCHDSNSWTRSIYDHQPEPENCSLCHLDDWMNANQTITGHFSLPNQCQSCHITRAWNEFSFDHSLTSFELTGMHLTTDCLLCHTGGFYLTPVECADCHMENFTAAADPDHSGDEFNPDECETCHSTLGWQPAVFHDPSQISICSDCHDFNGISDPLPALDHISAIKLGDQINNCTFCHQNAQDWLDVEIPHSVHDDNNFGIYFNIFSSTHSGKWSGACSENCHVFGRFDTFSCYEPCHEGIHSRSHSLDKHCDGSSDCKDCNGSNGYWIVNRQYSDGNWDDPATFIQCYECHPNGNMSGGCANDVAKPFDPRILPLDPKKKDKITK